MMNCARNVKWLYALDALMMSMLLGESVTIKSKSYVQLNFKSTNYLEKFANNLEKSKINFIDVLLCVNVCFVFILIRKRSNGNYT